MWVRELKYCELKKKENISHAIHWSSVTKQNEDAGDYLGKFWYKKRTTNLSLIVITRINNMEHSQTMTNKKKSRIEDSTWDFFINVIQVATYCLGTCEGDSVGKLFNKSFPFCCKSAATVSTTFAFAASSAARRMVSA